MKYRNVCLTSEMLRFLLQLSLMHCRGLPSLTNMLQRRLWRRDELVRAAWQAEYGDIPMEAFVWLDEASVDDHTNQRRNGWAPLGRACVQRYTFIRGQRFSVLPALSVDGIIA